MLLVFSIVTKAQWEKLPLFGGHVERFIENKFNTNDVFALVKNYGVWYSSDAGENWRTTNGNNNELLNRTISDLEITNDGIIYIITEQTPLVSTILCSTDQGARWNEIQLPLKYNISPIRNNIEVNANGDIFLYAISTHGPDLDYLLKTTDFGTTWVEVTIPGFDNWLFTNFIIDKDNPNIIFIFGANGYYAVTNDGGNTWTTTTMFKKYNLRPPFRINYRSINTYGMFAILPGGVVYDYFESQDTGKTWIKKNINIIPQGNGDNIIVLENGTMLTQGVDSLMTSTDEGVSWHGHAFVW